MVGIGTGAALAYIFDPNRGARRRALARDQMIRAARKTRDGVDATMRDVTNRTRGIAAAARGRLSSQEIDNERLVERVRSKLGRVCSHPRAIDVIAGEGAVTLNGPILSHEIDRVLATIAAVPGVHHIVNQLEPHESSDGVPSLQGRGRIAGPSLDILQRNWAPATQALVAAAGIAATGAFLATRARS
jgi:hypothetical protein